MKEAIMLDTENANIFEKLRPRLFLIAYRMLGMRADAEDVVQEAWMRWQRSERATVQSPQAWLVTITTRLAIDALRSRKAEREHYTGWWLPEPLVELDERTPETAAELASDVSMALLWMMERLGPEERAAFLMRKVFDHDYADLAAVLGRSEVTCRQLVHRALQRMEEQQPRFTVSKGHHRDLLAAFMQAAVNADRSAMKSFLSPAVQVIIDGGGKAAAHRHMIVGAGRTAGMYWAAEHAFPGRVSYRMARINGDPGLVRYIDGEVESAQAFTVCGDRITAIYMVRNPDKLLSVKGAHDLAR